MKVLHCRPFIVLLLKFNKVKLITINYNFTTDNFITGFVNE